MTLEEQMDEEIEPQPILYKVPDVARAYQISRSAAYELVSSGKLRAVRFGRSVRVRREDVERLARELAE